MTFSSAVQYGVTYTFCRVCKASLPKAQFQHQLLCPVSAWALEQEALRRSKEEARLRQTVAKARAEERAAAARIRRKEWRAGVAKIMAEVRRREADRALPEPPFFTSDNPLDGERLWS